MITLPSKDSCSFCLNEMPMKDGWIPCCKAFPDGIPRDYLFERIEVAELEECARGFHFEPDVEAQKRCGFK